MTREEAIKLLLESKDNDIERTWREWEEWDKRFFEAIDMAIEALQVEDPISRPELLKQLGISERFNADIPAWVIGVIKGMRK